MLTNEEVDFQCKKLFAEHLERVAGIALHGSIYGDTAINKTIRDYAIFHDNGFYNGIRIALLAVADGCVDIEAIKADLQKQKDEAKE